MSLRGLWGFCTRVELGGYMTCGVFASVFLLLLLCLPFSFSLCLAFCPLSFFGLVVFACSLVLSFRLCLCSFFFPCGLCAKRKGAKCLSLASSLVLLCVFRLWLSALSSIAITYSSHSILTVATRDSAGSAFAAFSVS